MYRAEVLFAEYAEKIRVICLQEEAFKRLQTQQRFKKHPRLFNQPIDKKIRAMQVEFISQKEAFIEMICNRIRDALKKAAEQNIKMSKSAAFLLLERRVHEVVRNSLDARATALFFTFEIIGDERISLRILDNGVDPIPAEKCGKYDWRKAILHNSVKRDTNQLGGCNLGLAMMANFLEMIGEGDLWLEQADTGGACITLNSTLSPFDMSRFSFANYILEMIIDLEKEAVCDAALLDGIKQKWHYPDYFESLRAKLVTPADLPVSTPTVVLTLPSRKIRRLIPVSSPLTEVSSPSSSLQGASMSTVSSLAL